MKNLTEVKVEAQDEHSFFTDKDHYLKFLQEWKKYINDGNHIPDTYEDSNGGVCKCASNLDIIHHLVYSVLRKKDLYKVFTPAKTERLLKYYNGDAYSAANSAIEYYTRSIKYLNADGYAGSHARGVSIRVKVPFGDTVTDDMLSEVADVLKDIKLEVM